MSNKLWFMPPSDLRHKKEKLAYPAGIPGSNRKVINELD